MKKGIFLLLLSTLLLSVVGCNKSGGAKKSNNTFYYNLSGTPTTLNPLSSTDAYSSNVHSYVLEGLLTKDIETNEWQPGLAESWSIENDGYDFVFKIREGVKWHDGKPFTVEDVKFSFDAVTHPENKYKTAHMKSYFANFKEAVVEGPRTIRFKASKKYFGNLMSIASGGYLAIVPKHIYENPTKEQEKELNKTLIGTGPYIFKELRRGKGISLVQNKDWWGYKTDLHKNEYSYGEIFMRFINESSVAIQRLEKGDLDFNALSPEEYEQKTNGPRWGKDVLKVKTENKSVKGYGFVGWNFKSPIFKSKEVRKAMNYLMNREEMNKKFRFGYSVLATGPLYVQSEYANKDVKAIPFNVTEAIKILKNDGWKDTDGDAVLDKMIDGKKTKLAFTILNPSKTFSKYLTMYQQDAKKAGVAIEVKYIEWNSFIKALDERNFDAVTLAWSGGSLDWDPKQIWHSDSAANNGSNFISYSNKEVDKLIDQAQLTLDKEARKTMLKKVYKLIAEDYPYIFLFNDRYTFYGHTKRMQKEKDTYTYGVGYGSKWSIKPAK